MSRKKTAERTAVLTPPASAEAAKPESSWSQAGAFLHRRAPVAALLLVALGTIRIALTYPVFNHIVDEPGHVACGVEWLERGTFKLEPLHPPLARVAMAIGPYLDGARITGRPLLHNEGAALIYGPDGRLYDRRLTLARLGILPFFWLACSVVYLWTAHVSDRVTAVLALFLFSFTPTILAHSGFATTDMALTSTLCAAMAAGLWLVRKPGLARGGLFGVCGALAILSKMTAMPFFASCALAAGVVHAARVRPSFSRLLRGARRLALPLLVSVVTLVLGIWAGYRFSYGPTAYTSFPLPFPELFQGIEMSLDKGRLGHPAYLLGELSQYGFWYYYPVALAVKLPLPLLVLTAAGIVICWKLRDPAAWAPLTLASGLLAFALSSPVNIGIRHVMPLLLLFAIPAGVALKRFLWSPRVWARRAGLALVVWMTATSALIHPDYVAYFNALAGDQPENIIVDSDLDWGQDMKRLAARLKQVQAPYVYFTPFLIAHHEAVHGFPPILPTDPVQPQAGWTAVHLTSLKVTRLGLLYDRPEIDPWPNRFKPTERIGKGILLYYFMPQQQAPAAR